MDGEPGDSEDDRHDRYQPRHSLLVLQPLFCCQIIIVKVRRKDYGSVIVIILLIDF